MRLRRSDLAGPGLGRRRRGRGFSYTDAEGAAVDAATRDRITSLAIPPGWADVWISPHANGHIQAVGTDDAGRRQYIYHPDWQEAQNADKHERVLRLARRLPRIRAAVSRDLRGPGLGRERVVAVSLRLLDAGLFRTGGEEYEDANGSHGVATLLLEHVCVRGPAVRFDFPAKSEQQCQAEIVDRSLARAIASLKRARTGSRHLLCYVDQNGWHELGSRDINAAFQDLAGDDFTVKDLRTWAATVAAAAALAEQDAADASASHIRRAALEAAAEQLGNIPAVAGRAYVDPRVFDEFGVGRTIPLGTRSRARVEGQVRRLLARR